MSEKYIKFNKFFISPNELPSTIKSDFLEIFSPDVNGDLEIRTKSDIFYLDCENIGILIDFLQMYRKL